MYSGGFEILALLFLILNYVITIIFYVMAFKILAAMYRFFKRTMPNDQGVMQFRNRSLQNWLRAYQFGDFLVRAGRYFYRFERSYLAQSLAQHRYQ